MSDYYFWMADDPTYYTSHPAQSDHGWVCRVSVKERHTTNKTYLEVTLPISWYGNVLLYGYVCALAGYDNAHSTYDFSNAERVAEKPHKWGDLALKYLVQECKYDSVEDFTEAIEYYGGTVNESHYTEDEEEEDSE